MAKPNKLVELEQKHGSLEVLIPDLVNRLGTARAAAEYLNTSQSTISTWLKEHGYILKLSYVKMSKYDPRNDTRTIEEIPIWE